MFPNAKLGFGECGFNYPQEQGAEFSAQVDKYYKMKKYNSHYVGGYFWWYYIEDCVPHLSNQRWVNINDACVWMLENLK